MTKRYRLNPFTNYTSTPTSPENSSAANTGTLQGLIGKLMFVAGRISGKNWWEAPDTDLSSTASHMNEGSTAHGGFVQRIQDHGSDLPIAPRVNLSGSGVTASYNATTNSIDATFSGGGGTGVDHTLLSTTHTDSLASDTPANGEVMVRSGGLWQSAPITDTNVAAANKDGSAAVPSLRTLGTATGQAAAGDDSRFHNQLHNLISTDHQDVTVSTPNHGDTLSYDGPTSKWVVVPNPASSVYVSPGLINGLSLTWDGANTLGIESGAAYIPGTSKVVELSSRLSRPVSFAASSSSFYYVYLYESSPGVADVLVSTTAPTSYHGFAKHMTGDNTRRYIGSVLPNGAATPAMRKWQWQRGDFIFYLENTLAAPFVVLSDGRATVETTISCGGVVPPSSTVAQINIKTQTGNDAYFGNSNDNITLSSAAAMSRHIGASYSSTGIVAQNTFLQPLNSSRQFSYLFNAAPLTGNGLYVYVLGYIEER